MVIMAWVLLNAGGNNFLWVKPDKDLSKKARCLRENHGRSLIEEGKCKQGIGRLKIQKRLEAVLSWKESYFQLRQRIVVTQREGHYPAIWQVV